MFRRQKGTWNLTRTDFYLDNDNITSRIAREEHFVQASEAKRDQNAIYIEFDSKEALEKLLKLTENPNYQEK